MPRALARALATYWYAGMTVFFGLKLKGPGVDATSHKNDLVVNADFRKFDDGLRMTLDCTAEFADKLEARLAAAEDYAHWGGFRQEAAQVTGRASRRRSPSGAMFISLTALAAAIRWPRRR